MADKQIAFTAVEQQQIEAIVIDKDKEEAIKFLAILVQRSQRRLRKPRLRPQKNSIKELYPI